MPRLPARGYQVAIPSYQRPQRLRGKTLATLHTRGVDPQRVTVFLHDHDPHLDEYRAILDGTGIHHEVTSQRGIIDQRSAIIHHYPAGTPLVQLDDDLTDLMRAVDTKTLHPVDNLDEFFRTMFTETAARDLHVWGLAPTLNAFYMKPGRLSEGLKFLIFACVGCYTRPDHPVHSNTVPTKDDYEFSIRSWWWDGAVLRADDVAPKADIYVGDGGCQAEGARTRQAAEDAVQELMRQWPGLVKRNTRRNSDFPEILLTPKKRHAGKPAAAQPPGEHSAA